MAIPMIARVPRKEGDAADTADPNALSGESLNMEAIDLAMVRKSFMTILSWNGLCVRILYIR